MYEDVNYNKSNKKQAEEAYGVFENLSRGDKHKRKAEGVFYVPSVGFQVF